MSIKQDINTKTLPQHIAIIMDGNGRWATFHNLSRALGHKEGVKSVKEIVTAAAELGIKYITLYAFSTENWNRPNLEVNALMSLFCDTIDKELQELIDNNIRLLFIGDIERVPQTVREKISYAMNRSKSLSGTTLIIALSYSSRWEITKAVQHIAVDVANNNLSPEEVNEQVIEKYLSTDGIPNPDMLIRTSGEYRISNFLLWQIAYSELYFTDVLWPDFGREEFYKAIIDFQHRERRFGNIADVKSVL